MVNTTWQKLISKSLKAANETWDDVEATTLTDEQKTQIFYDGYGGSKGVNFTLWTKNRVYFPVIYNGAQWVGSVARHPCDEASSHHGGE